MLHPCKEKVSTHNQGIYPLLLLALEKQTKQEDIPLYNDMVCNSVKLNNSTVLANLRSKMWYLSTSRWTQLSFLIYEFVDLFPDVPKQALHDVEIGNANPIM